MTSESFRKMIGQVRQRDEEAETQFFDRYFPQMLEKAAKKLAGSNLRRKEDEEDATLSAVRTLIRRLQNPQVYNYSFESEDELVGFLYKVTMTRVSRLIKKELAKKRGSGRVLNEADQAIELNEILCQSDEVFSTIHGAMRELDDREQNIVKLTLAGFSIKEIKHTLRISESATYRTRRNAIDKLKYALAHDPEI